MTKSFKTKQKGSAGVFKSLMFGMITGAAILMLIIALGAYAVTHNQISEDLIKTVVIAASFIASAVGGIVAVRLNKGASLPMGTGSAMLMLLLVLCIGALIKGGYVINKMTAVIMTTMLVGGNIGSLIGLKRKKSKR